MQRSETDSSICVLNIKEGEMKMNLKPLAVAKPDEKEVARVNRKNNAELRKADAEIRKMLK